MCPPHTPVAPAPEFVGKSGAKDEVKNDPEYGDWVYQGDHMLGQLLDALEKKGLAGNTLVIATADNAGEDSVSILPALNGTAKETLREATVHQSMGRDLAIRQDPWKLIFLKNGKRELYQLESDLGETKDLAKENPEVVGKIAVLMKRYVEEGRSTPGTKQPGEKSVSWPMLETSK
jgi:arylsulfatase A-like enzyme